MLEKEETVVTVANVIQIVFDVIKEAEGNAFEFPDDRKGNDALVLQDIKDAFDRHVKGVVAC